ncbi:hypothetical protein BC938DRAFT_478087 [Jimgerdemannia flammicorona]|uniref:Secreted protein n=1 Tax=Jimgerdemannia flammicorona TaxID=994334 RepID=A0A433QNE5_9FUNG|nr:hypothetical protein BC938DRAFT_478087 [Jimgerdemannia flammicorona]
MIWFVWTRLAVVFLAKATSHLISNGSDLRLVDKSSPFPGIPCSNAELTPAAIFLVAITLGIAKWRRFFHIYHSLTVRSFADSNHSPTQQRRAMLSCLLTLAHKNTASLRCRDGTTRNDDNSER